MIMEKTVQFSGDSEKVLKGFPRAVKEKFVSDLELMRYGMRPLSQSRSMSGLGDGVFELKKNGKPAYRLVYVIKGSVIYVLHAFSKTSSGTGKKHEDTIKSRYKRL